MKKILLIFGSCFLILNSSFAQSGIQWQKCLGGDSTDWAYSVKQTTDGGYIVAGFASSNNEDVTGNHGSSDYWVVKLDSSGNIQWQKCFGGTGAEGARAVEQTADGGYIVAGNTWSNDGDVTGNHGGTDYWIVKLDNIGNVQWQKCLGGTDVEWATSVEQTPDGGYIIAGYTYSNDGDVTGNHNATGSSADYWIVKLNSSGNLQWQKCLGGASDDWAYSIEQCADGGYIVAGPTPSNSGDVTSNHGYIDYWVVKLNSSGNIQWQKCLGGTGADVANSVHQTADGGYIVVGRADSNDGNVTGNHGLEDYWIVKLDNSGNIQLQKCLGGTSYDEAYSVQQTAEGGYIIAGVTKSNDGDVTGLHGNADYWVVKLNSSGNIQWQKCLGGTSYEEAHSVQQTADGGFIVAGYAESNDGDVTGFHGNADYWVVKLSPFVGIEEQTNNSFVNLFPNPATNELTIENPESSGLKIKAIEIYSSLGEKVFTELQTTNHKLQTVDVSQLPPAIYFITITDQAGNKVTKKVVKL